MENYENKQNNINESSETLSNNLIESDNEKLNDFSNMKNDKSKNNVVTKNKIKSKRKRKKKKLKKEPLTPMQKWSRFALVLSIILTTVALLPFFSTLVMIIVILVMFIALIFSLLTLLFNESFSNLLKNVGNIGGEAFKLIAYTPYVLFGASVFMGISLLLTILNKKLERKRTSIIVKSIAFVLLIAAGIIIEVLKHSIVVG